MKKQHPKPAGTEKKSKPATAVHAVHGNGQTHTTSLSSFTKSENYHMGKALREKCPHELQAKWKASADRHDPVQLVLDANKGRMPDLLPMRHGRMAASPFTFYRGAALNMAADLAKTPSSGIIVQCCGDAHLMNFGGFATPERRVILSINDLDETNPAPWEWDVKRLAASFVIASRNNDLGESNAKDMAEACVRSYREHMLEFSQMRAMELWYYAFDADTLIGEIDDPKIRKRALKRLSKEQDKAKKLPEEMFPKLTETPAHGTRIQDQLPSIFHISDADPAKMAETLEEAFRTYKATLAPAYQVLLDHYQVKDIAIKVVGIGSVGTFCAVLLLMDADGNPFFLQVKEARESVLEKYAGKSVFENHGQRIVNGYRLMQPYSDIFLGWTHGKMQGRDFFIRQLRDMKIKFNVETFNKKLMKLYADWCGKALALSHARSGESPKISGYMGQGDTFDKAIAEFSVAYADQNEKDYLRFKRAVSSGKVKAVFEVE
jgi:uncharacterized protein (DUF2252 family)